MCGIFGVIAKKGCSFDKSTLQDVLLKVAKYSEARGKDSSGIAFRDEVTNEISVLKGPVAISKLLKTTEFESLANTSLKNTTNGINSNKTFAALGHARLTTNGTHLKDINNQPVIKDGLVGVHNGIIVNVNELWEEHSDLKREYDIDTEVMLALLRKNLQIETDTRKAIANSIGAIFGTVATAIMLDDRDEFILATNNGSLYYLYLKDKLLVFASEKYILKTLIANTILKNETAIEVKQIIPNTGIVISLNELKLSGFNFRDLDNDYAPALRNKKLAITEKHILNKDGKQRHVVLDLASIAVNPKSAFERKLLEFNLDRISALRRCTKCLLPETFPFISFDERGVCNICNNYVKKNHPKPIEELQELVEPYRKKNGQPDCLVPFSGGRDSTYTLHVVKNILKMNPIAFTYDWGMVTDLARRNIARICGKLGVEHIIVAADIRWKRENIRKNIAAWLNKPALGMIPLFMAGDKFFFYYTDQLKKQAGIKLNIWGINNLENTDFKVGFAGVAPTFNKKRIYSLSMLNQLKLFGFVGKNIFSSPGYINQSVWDTLGSFATRYFAPKKDYYHLFDYYKWDEKEIEDLISNEYKWETAVDTKATWRIGDGTASFYNYVYYTVAGLSEYDTFRSNQIREGMLDRETALKLINEENRPRYETIKWYLEIIGLDFASVIKRINQIPKLY